MQGQNLLYEYVEMYVRRYGATAMLVKYTELTASLARELNTSVRLSYDYSTHSNHPTLRKADATT